MEALMTRSAPAAPPSVFEAGTQLALRCFECLPKPTLLLRDDGSIDRANAAVFNPSHTQRMQEQLRQRFDAPIEIDIEIGEPSLETPAQRRERLRAERLDAARAAIADDPNVRLLQQAFDARLDPNSIEPVE